MRLSLLLLSILFGISALAQIDLIPTESLEEFRSRIETDEYHLWTRDVWWHNTSAPVKFHGPEQKYMRVLHYLDPTDALSVETAWELEDKLMRNDVWELIHVMCTPRGLEADSTYVQRRLVELGLKAPVAQFHTVYTPAYMGVGQYPAVTLTGAGGKVVKKFSGPSVQHDVLDYLEEISEGRNVANQTKMRSYKGDPVVESVPQRLIPSLTYMTRSRSADVIYATDQRKNRILLIDGDGAINQIIGDYSPGFRDGFVSEARFNNPSGLAFDPDKNVLYIADTHNHAIRQVDLLTRQVTTLLGTGAPADLVPGEVLGTTGAIHSPTGIALSGETLFIAMTGFNQIWTLDLRTLEARAIAGDASPRTLDHPEDPLEASLDQPVDMAFDKEGALVILDRRSGNLRKLEEGKGLTTVFRNDSSEVKLAAPATLYRRGEEFLIPDPYRHRICSWSGDEMKVLAGTGESGMSDGKADKATFGEPFAIVNLGGVLYVSDSHYGVLRTMSGGKDKVGTFNFSGIGGLYGFEQAITEGRAIFMDEVPLAEGTNTLNFEVQLGEEYRVLSWGRNEISLADGKPQTRKMRGDGWFDGKATFEIDKDPNLYVLQFEVYVTYTLVENPAVIYYGNVAMIIPFGEEPSDQSTHNISFNLTEGMNPWLLP